MGSVQPWLGESTRWYPCRSLPVLLWCIWAAAEGQQLPPYTTTSRWAPLFLTCSTAQVRSWSCAGCSAALKEIGRGHSPIYNHEALGASAVPPLATERCLGLLYGMEAHQHGPTWIHSHPLEQHSLLQTDSMFCKLPNCAQLLSGHPTQTKTVPQLLDSAGWTARDQGRKTLQHTDITSILAFPEFFSPSIIVPLTLLFWQNKQIKCVKPKHLLKNKTKSLSKESSPNWRFFLPLNLLLFTCKCCWIPLMSLWIPGREVMSRRQFSFRDLFQPTSIKDIRQERKEAAAHGHILHTFLFETYFVIIILALSLSFNLICLPLNSWNRFVLTWTPCNWPLQYSWTFTIYFFL